MRGESVLKVMCVAAGCAVLWGVNSCYLLQLLPREGT